MTPADELKIDRYVLSHTKRSVEATHGSFRIRKDTHAELTKVASELGLVLLRKRLEKMALSFNTNDRVCLFYESVRLPPYSGLICAKTEDELPQLACDINTYILEKSQFKKRSAVVSDITTPAKPPVLGAGSSNVTGLRATADESLDGEGKGACLSGSSFGLIGAYPSAASCAPEVDLQEESDEDLQLPLKWVEGAKPRLDLTPKDISSVAHVRYLRAHGGYTYLAPGVRAKDGPLQTLVAADECWDYVAAHDSLPIDQKRKLISESGKKYAELAAYYKKNSRLHRFFKEDGSAIPKEERRLDKLFEKETPVSMKDFIKHNLLLSEDKCASDMLAMRKAVEPAKVDTADGKKRKHEGSAGLHDEDSAGPYQDNSAKRATK